MIIHHVLFMAASIKCLASPIVIDESLANECWLSWITDCVTVANGWRCNTIIVRVKLDRSRFDKHLNNEMMLFVIIFKKLPNVSYFHISIKLFGSISIFSILTLADADGFLKDLARTAVVGKRLRPTTAETVVVAITTSNKTLTTINS